MEPRIFSRRQLGPRLPWLPVAQIGRVATRRARLSGQAQIPWERSINTELRAPGIKPDRCAASREGLGAHRGLGLRRAAGRPDRPLGDLTQPPRDVDRLAGQHELRGLE